MAYDYSPIPWTDEQWARVTDTIQQEASRARVAATFLPLFGPLPADTDYVATDTVEVKDEAGNKRLAIDDTTTIPVPTLQVRVYVRGAQMADPELTSALQLFRRASNVLARLEDAVVFGGQQAQNKGPQIANHLPKIWEILGGKGSDGLVSGAGAKQELTADDSNALVVGVSKAISTCEADGHFGPFALVLGQTLFTTAQTPNDDSLVLPQDRIIPFLEGGSLLRSSLIPDDQGVLVALGGTPVELVVATDISLNFLQVTPDPMFVFRVFEKVVLRIKEPGAIVRLETKK
jgi:uncharacterized linocin/CFP29 family protein